MGGFEGIIAIFGGLLIVGLLMYVIIGGFAGFFASKLMGADNSIWMNIALGIGGALILKFFLGFFVDTHTHGLFVNFITAIAGACGLIYGYRLITKA